ncbi:MAG: hypothetical protein AAGH76_00510 [Pseudomonadota bacterium]
MNWLKKRHGRLTPPGLEVKIFAALPRVFLIGTLAIACLPFIVRWHSDATKASADKAIRTVDIFAIATEVTFITALVTVAIGCIIVHIMKGPAYEADSLPVSHADEPSQKVSRHD